MRHKRPSSRRRPQPSERSLISFFSQPTAGCGRPQGRRPNMKRLTSLGILCLSLIASVWAATGDKEKDRIRESENVLKDILEAPDKGVPLDVMDGTKCAIVIPSEKKAAFILGGSYGRGVMMCRTGENFKGPWSPPIMMATESGSIG